MYLWMRVNTMETDEFVIKLYKRNVQAEKTPCPKTLETMSNEEQAKNKEIVRQSVRVQPEKHNS